MIRVYVYKWPNNNLLEGIRSTYRIPKGKWAGIDNEYPKTET